MYCQIVYLRGCLPRRIRHALTELPETLDDTYKRTLREINHANWELAHHLLQCIAVASRPLRVQELADVLAFDFEAGPIARFYSTWRLENPAYTVLNTCSSLVSIVNLDGSQVIQFSHFTVKEFLTSTRLAETSDVITRRYHISMISAHTLAAQACLGILLHLDKDITRDGLQKLPLVEYAARHWFDHAQFENVFPNVEHGMKQLFDPSKPHLTIWVWIYDPACLWHTDERSKRPSLPLGGPLHYAALCGLHTMVPYLVVEHSQDVNAWGLYKKSTPLHWASFRGHVEVVRALLKHGADVTAQNEDGMTPLHWASRKGRAEAIDVLLQHGADATARDINKSTPLHHASIGGYVESVRVFLEHNVDSTAQDKNGWTPLHCASYEGHVGVTRTLLEHGVDATVRDRKGRTPLHRVSSEGNLEVILVFLEHGVDLTAQDKDGWTPLHRASLGGHVEVVRVLLDHGVDMSAQDKNGCAPLHYASREGHVEVIRALLTCGACATAKDKNGWSPLFWACEKGREEVVRILLECGKDMTPQAKDYVWSQENGLEDLGGLAITDRNRTVPHDVISNPNSPSPVAKEHRSRPGALDFGRIPKAILQQLSPRSELTRSPKSPGMSSMNGRSPLVTETSTLWTFHTARTAPGQPSHRSDGPHVVSRRNGPSSDASTSGDALAPSEALDRLQL